MNRSAALASLRFHHEEVLMDEIYLTPISGTRGARAQGISLADMGDPHDRTGKGWHLSLMAPVTDRYKK